VSPSQKPYWRIALEAAKPHLTQLPGYIQQLSKLSEDALNKMMSEAGNLWWSEPMTLIFGKATVPTQPTDPIFPDETAEHTQAPVIASSGGPDPVVTDPNQPVVLELGDPWHFYREFRHAHKLTTLPVARIPEIALKDGSVVGVPLVITRKPDAAHEISLKIMAPTGWKVISGEGKFLLPDVEMNYLRVELQSPQIAENELKGRQPDSIVVSGTAGGKSIGQAELRVLLRSSALPQ
jgi:hypothetical protein